MNRPRRYANKQLHDTLMNYFIENNIGPLLRPHFPGKNLRDIPKEDIERFFRNREEDEEYKDRSMYDPYYGDSSDWDMEIDEEEYSEDDEAYLNDVDEDMIEPLQEQVNKTLDMFNRFKRY